MMVHECAGVGAYCVRGGSDLGLADAIIHILAGCTYTHTHFLLYTSFHARTATFSFLCVLVLLIWDRVCTCLLGLFCGYLVGESLGYVSDTPLSDLGIG